jgi:hypothetical protein
MRKVKEKNDKYYLTKYQITEDQLAEYKKKLEEINDPDLIIEDLIEPEISLKLSKSAKIVYLEKLRGKILTILYLIEQQKINPEINPDSYMVSLIIDIRGANMLFNDTLTEICVKVCGIYATHKESEFSVIRKQVLETRRLVDDLLAEIKKSEKE